MQLIPENEKDILRSMSSACIGSAVGRNYVFSKLGKFINSAQIAYFTSEPDRALVDGMKKSDTDSLLEFFESTEDISYHTLWDVPLDNGSTALISTLNVDRELGFAEIDHTDDPDFTEPRESATITRTNPRVQKNARIFMAAWANKFDIRTFSLFPNSTHDRSNLVRDSIDKIVVILMIYEIRHTYSRLDVLPTQLKFQPPLNVNVVRHGNGVYHEFTLCFRRVEACR